jgi:hypothetical protein
LSRKTVRVPVRLVVTLDAVDEEDLLNQITKLVNVWKDLTVEVLDGDEEPMTAYIDMREYAPGVVVDNFR